MSKSGRKYLLVVLAVGVLVTMIGLSFMNTTTTSLAIETHEIEQAKELLEVELEQAEKDLEDLRDQVDSFIPRIDSSYAVTDNITQEILDKENGTQQILPNIVRMHNDSVAYYIATYKFSPIESNEFEQSRTESD